ncbi:Co-chaperone Hsc20 [Dothidotthia symphoricarpi CBS 119687]|uniref:Co-chaperone Hsc20 n=1 Tax=Dothidotthia symphoricarpi CBS 119687 TaxID=1392245 RepID=A0A6A6AM98_9PLEO|nr:Co-chaperone Hsc20 [Dothidotthia symphoricarpi CBS 119687]KAF2133059.1 Co-chaperone Hsc20 [Dothidotthia symphoricarpi CBS 119687]
MHSIRPTAIRRLRATLTSESPVSPLRTQFRPSPCLLCTHRIQPQPQQHTARRHQSTSSSNAKESPFASTAPQPATAPQTHYAFFPTSLPTGPPPTGPFTIDLSALKREFLQLQARAHPDLHPQHDKKRAEALSARINEAYKTLQSPLLRAQYLLSLRGIDVADDEQLRVEDPGLLMEVLEAREQIEEAQEEGELEGMRVENDARIEESVGVLERCFAEDDVEGAKGEAVKLRYWINIAESIGNWEKGVPVVLQH